MTSPPQLSRRAATAALLSLAIGSFGIGMGEFVIMGLLPNAAHDLLPALWASTPDEAIAHAGWLVSLYALGVVIGAPLVAGFVARHPRHRVLLVIASVLVLGNLLTVFAPTFETVALARFLTGLPHGAYFGIGALVAADVLGPGNRGKGVAYILSGLTIANVVGVPAGTFLGQHLGWRAAYVVVAAIFALGAVSIALFVPPHSGDPGRTMRAELRAFRLPQLWLTLASAAIGFGGFFAVYSYIAPMVTQLAGEPQGIVPLVLVLLGVGMTIGNVLGGHAADRDLRRAFLGGYLLCALVLLFIMLTAQWIVLLALGAVLIGATSSFLSPAVQTRLMDVAEDNQSIAAALNHSALNLGNSLGAFLGGAAIAAGWGFRAPSGIGLILAVLGFGIGAFSYALQRRRGALRR